MSTHVFKHFLKALQQYIQKIDVEIDLLKLQILFPTYHTDKTVV